MGFLEVFWVFLYVFRGVPGCLEGVPGFLEGVPGCSGFFTLFRVFRGVPGCSGVFRGVLVFRVPVFLELLHAGKKPEMGDFHVSKLLFLRVQVFFVHLFALRYQIP